MEKRNIIVIGASAGGFNAIRRLVADLPSELDAAIFIVWHMSPDIRSILPEVINRQKTIRAANAIDKEPIINNRIYVAPPDHHLVLENGYIRITRGPKENRFRPAVDPLFRSAAYIYGPRVIGIVLSGALDDGTSGLWTIKNRGGIAIVQDPQDAEVPSMPENAMRAVEVDHVVPISGMAALLEKLVAEPVTVNQEASMEEENKTRLEILIAMQDKSIGNQVLQLGELTPYACPECHGVLSAIREGNLIRYRCHTGHAYSADSLLASVTENIEESLWNAIRAIEESIILLNHFGDHFAESNKPKIAATYFRKANDAGARVKLVRQAVLLHEQLNAEIIHEEAETDENRQNVPNSGER